MFGNLQRYNKDQSRGLIKTCLLHPQGARMCAHGIIYCAECVTGCWYDCRGKYIEPVRKRTFKMSRTRPARIQD